MPRLHKATPHKGNIKKRPIDQGKSPSAAPDVVRRLCFYLEEATDMCISENYVKYQRS